MIDLRWQKPYSNGIIRGAQYIIELVVETGSYYYPAVFSDEEGWNVKRHVLGAAYFASSPRVCSANERAWELCKKLNQKEAA